MTIEQLSNQFSRQNDVSLSHKVHWS